MLLSSFLQELNPFSSWFFVTPVGIRPHPSAFPQAPCSLPTLMPPPSSLPESNCSLFHCTNMPFKITHRSRLLVTT